MTDKAENRDYHTPITTYNQEKGYKAKKEMLRKLSAQVKPMVKMGLYPKVNDALVGLYSQEQLTDEWHTCPDWNKRGFKVKKGEKAYTIWGRKRTHTPKPDATNGDDEYKYFPLAYIFSSNQVEKSDHATTETV